MQKKALFQYSSNPYSQSVVATLCKPPFGMLTKTTNFQFGSFRSPERNDSGLIKERAFTSNSYRFGFNGMEKVDEVSGEGNSYTAEYWQYDSRMGRRWNVDPIFKFYKSSYDAFSNNPINRIDPNGDDDFFDKDGNYLGSIGKGSAIKLIDDKKCFETINEAKISTAKKLQALEDHGVQDFNKFDFNKSNLESASKIITHYYNELYTTKRLHKGRISLIVNDRQLKHKYIVYNEGTRGLAGASAWTTHDTKDNTYKITFKFLGSLSDKSGHYRIYATVENSHDLNILLKHEDYHGKNHKNVVCEGSDKALVSHLDAYYYSISYKKDKDWQNVSENFKSDYEGSIVQYINDIQDKTIRQSQIKKFEKYLSEKSSKNIKNE